ncbi:ThiF family adenylyltransferase [Arcanobacterium canis]|uniref:THIF-type NAD/FAD binding fold domain-containing protein n=1 Tax=Arcanobacterium canis TaxID=999183 RepID=A0ABY8FZ33_9ACTO|nr:ThiF family adenylyltransferase [Arcanobacterium canis]WFM83000.1 hypothetical protein P7079_06275 [Arcanobacterium canis]
MQLPLGMNIYWRNVDEAVIGIDPRLQLTLEDFTRAESTLLESLEHPISMPEFRTLAERAGIGQERTGTILSLLKSQKLLSDCELRERDQEPYWRTHGRTHSRISRSVLIYRADYLGVQIALNLAQAGVGRIECSDSLTVSSVDHPLLQRAGFGLPRREALTSELRAINPKIIISRMPARVSFPNERSDDVQLRELTRTGASSRIQSSENSSHSECSCDLVVLSGSHALDPFTSRAFLAEGIPVFHACAQEYDLVVGPFALPEEGTCAQCIYLHRLESDPHWNRIGPQAVCALPAPPHSSACALAAALATREILAFLDRSQILLGHSAWVVPPTHEAPRLIPMPVHPECGCCATI